MVSDETKRKTLSYLGFARRCGKVSVGSELAEIAIRKHPRTDAVAVVIAGDASERTAKRLRDKCSFYGVSLFDCGATRDELAEALGKSAPTAAAAVTEPSLARAIAALYKGSKEGSKKVSKETLTADPTSNKSSAE